MAERCDKLGDYEANGFFWCRELDRALELKSSGEDENKSGCVRPEDCPLKSLTSISCDKIVENKEIKMVRIDVCPQCGSEHATSQIKDCAFSIHYIDDRMEYTCVDCGHVWLGESVGYRGLA